MTSKPLPSPELLRKLLRYEPETGKLFWRARTPDMFLDGYRSAIGNCRNWNSKFANEEAMTAIASTGYLCGTLSERVHSAHRVCFTIHHGHWPEYQIDHINGVTTDNRIANLRDVTRRENHKNRRMSPLNTSGVNGVWLCKLSGKWVAEIMVDGRKVSLGRFTDILDAARARKSANVKYGFSKRHGGQYGTKSF